LKGPAFCASLTRRIRDTLSPLNWKPTATVLASFFLTTANAAELPVSVERLRTVDEVRLLTYAEARMAPPVLLRVTVVSHLDGGFDGQGVTGGLFFETLNNELPPLGEFVEVYGNVTGGFYGPYIVVDEIHQRGQRNLPRPLIFRPDFVQTGIGDNRLISIEGLMVDVEFDESNQRGKGLIVNGQTDLTIRFRNEESDFNATEIQRMIGAWVRVQGSGAPLFNDARQRIGSDIVCSSQSFIEVVNEGLTTQYVPLGDIGRWDSRRATPGLVRTIGKVTLVEGLNQIVIQSGDKGARVKTLRPHETTVGDTLEFKGLPDNDGYFVGLRYASNSLSTAEVSVNEPLNIEDSLSRENAFQLVSLSGKLIGREGRILNLESGNNLIPVTLPEKFSGESLPAEGSTINITGVKIVDADERGELRSVTIMMRSLEDLAILATPSWWTPKRYWTVMLFLAGITLLVLVWTFALNRQVSSQTTLIECQIQSNAALEERNRIARELHDTLSQGFSGVGYQLASIDNHLETDPDKARSKLAAARGMVEHSLAEARDSLTGLRIPLAAESLKFPDSMLEIMSERCQEASIELEIIPIAESTLFQLDTETAYACHSILLEALANTIRHSGASKLTVIFRESGKTWEFTVRDDGDGFDAQTPIGIGHYGLQGMKERARQIGAKLNIESSKDGTSVALVLPKV
jgi:signal transduction histidine kinase